MHALATQTTGAERFEYLYKAEQIAMEDYALIPIYYYVNKWQVAEEVQGWELTANGKMWFGDITIVE